MEDNCPIAAPVQSIEVNSPLITEWFDAIQDSLFTERYLQRYGTIEAIQISPTEISPA